MALYVSLLELVCEEGDILKEDFFFKIFEQIEQNLVGLFIGHLSCRSS